MFDAEIVLLFDGPVTPGKGLALRAGLIGLGYGTGVDPGCC